MKYDINDFSERVSKKLKKKRYIHSLGVMYTAQALAMKYEISLEDAGAAGILHDIAKEMDGEELIAYCNRHNIPVSATEKKAPYLLHGKAGAHIAKKKYGIEEEYILDAIRFHTTGKPRMTMLEKIIFVADYIEPGRKQYSGNTLSGCGSGYSDTLNTIRKEAFTDLDRACALIMRNTIDYLKSDKNKHIDSTSIEAYEYYKVFL